MSAADRCREAIIEVRDRLVLPTDADDALVVRTLLAAWEEMHTPTPFVNISKARFEAMAAVVEAASREHGRGGPHRPPFIGLCRCGERYDVCRTAALVAAYEAQVKP